MTLPASPPYYVLLSAFPTQSISTLDLTIPNDPNLVGLPVVMMNVSFSPGPILELSQHIEFTICQ